MSIRVKRSSGHYEVALTEETVNQPRTSQDAQRLECVVQFLDDSTDTFFVDKRAFGQALYDQIFDYLEILDRDYFGLQFFDTQLTENAVYAEPLPDGRYLTWLEALAPIQKQVPMNMNANSNGRRSGSTTREAANTRISLSHCSFLFRVKYYASDPARLFDEYTRYQLFQQLRKDLLDGRLMVNFRQATILASYALQSELGDYHQAEHGEGCGYVAKYRFVTDQSREFEAETARLHDLHRGQSPADAELNFLNRAKALDFYGMRLYKACMCSTTSTTSNADKPVRLGVSGIGISVFSMSNERLDMVVWNRILKLSFHKAHVLLVLRSAAQSRTSTPTPKSIAMEQLFSLDSGRMAKHFWKAAIEHHSFFRLHKLPVEIVSTLQRTAPAGGSSFLGRFGSFRNSTDISASVGSLTSSFRYSTRTEFQTLEDSQRRARLDRSFVRGASGRSRSGARSAYPSALPTNPRRSLHTAVSVPPPQFVATARPQMAVNQPSDPAPGPKTQSQSQSVASTPFQTPTHAPFAHDSPSRTTHASQQGGSQQLDATAMAARSHQPNAVFWSASNSRDQLNGFPADRLSASVEQLGTQGSATPRSSTSPSYALNTSENELDAGDRRRAAVTATSGDVKVSELANTVSQLIGQQTRALLDRTGSSYLNAAPVPNGSAPHEKHDGVAVHPQLPNDSPQTQTNFVSPRPQANVHTAELAERMSTFDASKSLLQEPTRKPWLARIAQGIEQSPADVGSLTPDETATSENTGTGSGAAGPLITVHLRPDASGRYGFNVKGGTEHCLPVVVSKITPGMPADMAVPRLHEGDQLVSLNGWEVQRVQHTQLVAVVRQLGKAGCDLFLVVRPTSYYLKPPELLLLASVNGSQQQQQHQPSMSTSIDDDSEVSLCDLDLLRLCYAPNPTDPRSSSAAVPAGGMRSISPSPFSAVNLEQLIAGTSVDLFKLSVTYLRQSLTNGSILQQFERLHRRKPGYSVQAANLPANLCKNRYQDVQPYDATRVVLSPPLSGNDYVNASYVNLNVPNTGIVMRYVATQGPLPNTVCDFWEMVWQVRTTLVVALTSLVEQGRTKCASYWPDTGTAVYGRLECTCVRELSMWHAMRTMVSIPAYTVREIMLKDVTTCEERCITQLHFDRWPDHGVPENLDHFIRFLITAREERHGSNAPVVVHCSAGIGRTGVFIFLDTLITLVEHEQPLNLLYFVHQMRTQRALLIQNRTQFEYCCTLILRLIDDGVLRSIARPGNQSSARNQRTSANHVTFAPSPLSSPIGQPLGLSTSQLVNSSQVVSGNADTIPKASVNMPETLRLTMEANRTSESTEVNATRIHANLAPRQPNERTAAVKAGSNAVALDSHFDLNAAVSNASDERTAALQNKRIVN